MTVAKDNFPKILEACNEVAMDNGGRRLDSIEVNDVFDLPHIEAKLKELTQEEFMALCIGERDADQRPVIENHEAWAVDAFLEWFFEMGMVD